MRLIIRVLANIYAEYIYSFVFVELQFCRIRVVLPYALLSMNARNDDMILKVVKTKSKEDPIGGKIKHNTRTQKGFHKP